MKVQTTDYGVQDIDPETIIMFPRGVPGFEESKQFALLREGESPTVYLLQSIDNPAITFSVVRAEEFNIGYEFELNDDEVAAVALEAEDDIDVLLVLWKEGDGDDGNGEGTIHSGIRANVKSPIVLNLKKRLAIQKTLHAIERYTVIKESPSRRDP